MMVGVYGTSIFTYCGEAAEKDRKGLPQDASPETYFLHLGATSQSFQNLSNIVAS
jgi:hypothetical protein